MSASMSSGRDGPSVRRLIRWLDKKPAKLERYLAAHTAAEQSLDDELERLSALSTVTQTALIAAFSVPEDLAERLRARIGPPPSGTETSAVVLDLLGVGWETMRVLLNDEKAPPQ